MNEYRQNAINHLKTHLGCVGYRDYLVTELEKLEIERSEYEKIKFQRDISMQQIHDLGNSVSKAIEEMEKFKEDVASTKDLYAQSCVGYCIEILKRNIGE